MSISFSTDLDFLVLGILVLVTISQAILGIGILIWGTPLFLLLGINFVDTLLLLLPLSLVISSIQIVTNLEKIDKNLIFKFLNFSIPGIIFGLGLVLYFQFDISIFVGLSLLISLIIKLKFIQSTFSLFSSANEKVFLFIIGLVHGFSNLGGPLIVMRVAFEKFDKEKSRSAIACVYSIFALTQLIMVMIHYKGLNISIPYLIAVVSTYFLSHNYIFKKLDNKTFNNSINILILIMAILLMVGSY